MFPFNYGFGYEEPVIYENDPTRPYKLYNLDGKRKQYISQHVTLFEAMDAAAERLKWQTKHEDLYIDSPESKTYLKQTTGWRQI